MTERRKPGPKGGRANGDQDQKTPTSQRHQIQPSEKQSFSLQGANLGPGLGRGFPLRLEFVLSDLASDSGPFTVLSDGGRGSRVYLGRITAGHEASNRYVAIKMQTPRPSHEATEDAGGLLTHQVRERRWLRELEHYRAVADVDQGFTPVYFAESPPERSGQNPRPRPWPALLFCSERKVLFQPVTERGGPLGTCRDEELLAAHGLPPYSESVETYLYNRRDLEEGAEPVFYQEERDGRPPHPNARPFSECLEVQGRVAGLPGADPPALETAGAVEKFAALAAGFPCLTCPEREPCYGEKIYTERLSAFALEDTNALVLELNDFHYDEFCNLLGGIQFKEFHKEHLGRGAGQGQQFRLRGVEQLIQLGQRFMFNSDGEGMDALEIFKLKWTLFTQLCQAAFEFHRRCGTAHLRIEPRHAMIRLEPGSDYLPSMWRFSVRLISLGAMALQTRPAEGETAELLALPANSNPVFDAEIVRNSSFGIVQRAGFILTAVEPVEGEGRYVITAEIQHDGIGMEWLSGKDRIKVTLRHIVGTSDIAFFALRDPDKEYDQRTIYVRSHPIELAEEQVDALNRIYGVKVHNVGFALYPMFQVPCDVFSLGMMLYRTLVVNDRQAIGDVSLTLEGLKQDLAGMMTVDSEEGHESEFWQALIEGHKRRKAGEIFGRHQIFYCEDDRDSERPNAIAQPLWDEALLLGLQMITSIEGFSFTSNHGDFDLRYPAGKMEPVLRRCQEILRKIDSALFSATRRNAEVRAALESVMLETVS